MMVPSMKVLCAPNAFKGTLTALEAAKAMARGVRRAGGCPILLPVADGGDGTAAILGGNRVRMIASGPYGERLRVEYRRKGRRAVVEVAQVGLARTNRREPALATSLGVAEMIVHAAKRGAREVIVALGGSASVDAGAGLLAGLSKLTMRPRLVAACDVSTRFLDAPRRFGPQKGATRAEVADLERYFRGIVMIPGGRRAARLPGSGAAGGIGWALALLGADLRPGAAFVLDALHFDDALRHCDFVLTGEGKWDTTTREGKAPWEVMRRARRAGVPCIALCGVVEGRPRGVRAIAASGRTGSSQAARRLEDASCSAVTSMGLR